MFNKNKYCREYMRERRKNDSLFRQRQKEANKKWVESNKDKFKKYHKEYAKKYYIKHRRTLNKYKREYNKKTNYTYQKTPNQRKIQNIRRETRRLYPLYKCLKCEFCKNPAIERHHYTKPIEFDKFNYICIECHKRRKTKMKSIKEKERELKYTNEEKKIKSKELKEKEERLIEIPKEINSINNKYNTAVKEIDIQKRILELQLKYPGVKTPYFNVESTPEWEMLKKEEIEAKLEKVTNALSDWEQAHNQQIKDILDQEKRVIDDISRLKNILGIKEDNKTKSDYIG